jgi:hypothetical protein
MKKTCPLMLILFVVFWSTGNKNQKPKSNATVEVIDGCTTPQKLDSPLR